MLFTPFNEKGNEATNCSHVDPVPGGYKYVAYDIRDIRHISAIGNGCGCYGGPRLCRKSRTTVL